MTVGRVTHARVLTPAGRGAIAVVEVVGADAATLIDRCFSPGGRRTVAASAIDAIRFGAWGGDGGEEVIVVRTAPDAVEIHCHGGSAATNAILNALANQGASIDTPLSGPWSLSEDADRLLQRAPTERVAAILLDQANGAFEHAINEALDCLRTGDTASAAATIDQLLRYDRLAKRLVDPWRIVLTGPPNVGKSSLINALVGYERAVVFDQPGTTRDIVTAAGAIDGWPVVFADTAGIREADDPLEHAGVQLAESEIAAADVVVAVREAGADRTGIDEQATRVLVANKRDLAPGAKLADREIATSATTGDGVPLLFDALREAIGVASPAPGEAAPFRQRHIQLLRDAEEALRGNACELAMPPLLALLRPSDFAD